MVSSTFFPGFCNYRKTRGGGNGKADSKRYKYIVINTGDAMYSMV